LEAGIPDGDPGDVPEWGEGSPWTGSGKYTVFVALGDPKSPGAHLYSVDSVNFSSATTTIFFSSAKGISLGGGNEATLIIQNIPANVYAYGADGGGLGIFPLGTTSAQAMAQTGVVTGAELPKDVVDETVSSSGQYSITIALSIINESGWTGNGTFTVFVVLGNPESPGAHYYSGFVTFLSGTATIPFGNVSEI
jgi:hypothetical protein